MTEKYTDETRDMILGFKDVVSLKEFFYQAEKIFEQTNKRRYLLLYDADKMVLNASENFDKSVDVFIFKINHKDSDKRIVFHNWGITQSEITLVDYKRKIKEVVIENYARKSPGDKN